MSPVRNPLKRYAPTNPEWLRNGKPRSTFRGNIERALATSNLTLTSGGMLSLALPLYAGDLVTNLTFWSGNVAAVTPTNWWFALYDMQTTPALIAQTADQTTTAWGTNTGQTLALSTPYRVIEDGLYYASVMMAAATPVNLIGLASGGRASLGIVTGQATLAQTSGSGLTTTAPATITSGSATGYMPLVYAT